MWVNLITHLCDKSLDLQRFLLTEGKKKFKNIETAVIRIAKKKKKKRLKVKLTPNKGTVVIKNLSFNVSND
jgi:hypothetical protein